MALKVQAWFRSASRDAVRPYLHGLLAAEGFKLSPGVESDAEGAVQGWDLVSLHRRKTWYALGPRTEDHLFFEVAVRGRVRQGTPVADAFLDLFAALTSEAKTPINECILAATSADVYPFFTHSFSFGQTLRVIELSPENGVLSDRVAGAAGYWKDVDPRLHFVRSHLLPNAAAGSAEEWGAKLGAAVIHTSGGFVFDCGWSEAGFPTAVAPGAGARGPRR